MKEVRKEDEMEEEIGVKEVGRGKRKKRRRDGKNRYWLKEEMDRKVRKESRVRTQRELHAQNVPGFHLKTCSTFKSRKLSSTS